MAAMASEEEFSCTKRKSLLESLSAVLSVKIPPTTWACLWLADLDPLAKLLAKAEDDPTIFYGLCRWVEAEVRIVQAWCQRKRSTTTTSASHDSTPQKRDHVGQPIQSHRSRSQHGQVHERDQQRCVVTKAGQPYEIAHIYPFSLRNEHASTHPASFWRILRYFWSNERIDAWHDAIFQGGGTEVCQNLLCLAPQVHAYWTRAYFALKPLNLSEDKKRLEVQFFWLSSVHSAQGRQEMNILDTPSFSNLAQGPNLAKLWNHENEKKIQSGDIITLQTDDPVLQPLPDTCLLEMQWILHRVTSMSGAAEVEDDQNSDNNGDDDGRVLCDWESEEFSDNTERF